MVGCSSDSAEEDDAEAEKEETEEKTEAAEEKDVVHEDDELFKVVEKNVQTMADKDIDGHMETIYPDESDGTKDMLKQLEDFALDIEVTNLEVEIKDDEVARV